MRMRASATLIPLLVVGCLSEENLGNTFQGTTPDALPEVSVDAAPAGPMPIADGSPGLDEMAIDATHLYWVENGQYGPQSTVRRIPRGGGDVETIVTVVSHVYALALDETHVYFGHTLGPPGGYQGSVQRVAKGGGAVELLTDGYHPTSVAVADGWVYYSKSHSPDGQIWRVPTSGGVSELVVEHADGPADLAVSGGVLYYSEMNLGRIMRVPASGGETTVLAEGWTATSWLALDDDHVYFAACSNYMCDVPALYRVPQEGGDLEHLHDVDIPGDARLAVDGDVVIWGNWLIPIGGSTPTELFPLPAGEFAISGVAADGGDAFVGEFYSGDVYKATY